MSQALRTEDLQVMRTRISEMCKHCVDLEFTGCERGDILGTMRERVIHGAVRKALPSFRDGLLVPLARALDGSDGGTETTLVVGFGDAFPFDMLSHPVDAFLHAAFAALPEVTVGTHRMRVKLDATFERSVRGKAVVLD